MSRRDEGITPSAAGDYRCPHCGDRLSYPPETYYHCPVRDRRPSDFRLVYDSGVATRAA